MVEANEEFPGTGRFRILRRLGEGGMGVVYAAHDGERNEVVALKTLKRTASSALYLFKREFRALADVAHPNLINLYEFLVDGDRWFFTMELVDGVPFLDFVAGATERLSAPEGSLLSGVTTSPVPSQMVPPQEDLTLSLEVPAAGITPVGATPWFRESELRSALRQLVEGLVALHDRGILHCDIKSSNVLVTPVGRVVILDFGISTERGVRDDSGALIGTPIYMSPEQTASEPMTEASDWYSVGVLLYRALTGRYPFEGSLEEVIRNKQSSEPPPPGDLIKSIPHDLGALCHDLLRRRPDGRPTGREVLARLDESSGSPSTVPPPLSAGPETPFLGRERLLSELDLAFNAVKDGHTVSVWVHGASGMGKSALIRHFLGRIDSDEHALVLSGRCYERESVPYKAVDGIVDRLSWHLMSLPDAEVRDLMPAGFEALSRLFPLLEQVHVAAGGPRREHDTPDPLALRRQGFAALRGLLGRLGERRPLVLWIDDLQWSDADSIALIDDLLRPPDSPRLLLLASFRAEEIDVKPFLRDLLTQTGSSARREMSVDPLGPEESRRLARVLLGAVGASSEALVDAIVAEAEGSPFLAEQLALGALESRAPARERISLADILNARLDRLPAGARPLAATLAVAGRPVESAVAHAASRLTGDERPIVAALRAARLLRSSGSASRVELYHDRIRETLLSLIEPDRRRFIHRSLAETLEARSVEDPEGLYHHYMGAEERGRAGVYAVVAARKAAGALAFDQAALYYRRALDIAPIEGADSVELQASLGDALVNAGQSADAARVLLDLAHQVDAAEALKLRRRAAEQLLMSGRTDEGIAVIRSVLGAVGLELPAGPRRALFSLLLRRAHLRLRGLGYVERRPDEIPQEDLQRIDVCWAVAAGLSLSDTIRGADFQTRNLLLSLRSGEIYRIARAISIETGFSSIPGGPNNPRAAELQRMAEALAGRVGEPHAIGVAALWAGVAACLLGEWRKAFEYCDRALDILSRRCVGVALDMATAQRFLLYSLMNLGEIRELSRRFPTILAAAREQGNLYLATDLRTAMNVVWLVDDDPVRAREEVAGALQEWSHQGFLLQHYYALQALTHADLYTGAGVQANTRVEEHWPAMKRSLLLRIQTVRIEALYFRGRSALAAAASGGHVGTSLRLADRVAHRIERERMAWSRPVAALLRAGAASLRGHRFEAVELLSIASGDFARADMALYAAVARRRLGELRGGDEGSRVVSDADGWMAGQGIRNPRRFARLLAPGFPADSEA